MQRLLYCSKWYFLIKFRASYRFTGFQSVFPPSLGSIKVPIDQEIYARLCFCRHRWPFSWPVPPCLGTCMMTTLSCNHGNPVPQTGILCSPVGGNCSLTLSLVVTRSTSVFVCVVSYFTATNSLQPAAHSGF